MTLGVKKTIAFKSMIVSYVILLLPPLLFGETAGKMPPTVVCPDNLQSALISMKNNLKNKTWINIDIDFCPHIQSEIIKTRESQIFKASMGVPCAHWG